MVIAHMDWWVSMNDYQRIFYLFHDFLNAFPSRKVALIMYVLLLAFSIMIRLKAKEQADTRNNDKRLRRLQYWFVYCDGKKSNVIWREPVSYDLFNDFETNVSYGVIDRNNTCVYFNVDL